MSRRHDEEAATVREKFPSGTEPMALDGYAGWLYSFRCASGNPYTMFIFWNGSQYKVMLVAPAAERDPGSTHEKHLFQDGCICLGSQQRSDFQHVYSQSVLWATGYTIKKETGRFPFLISQ